MRAVSRVPTARSAKGSEQSRVAVARPTIPRPHDATAGRPRWSERLTNRPTLEKDHDTVDRSAIRRRSCRHLDGRPLQRRRSRTVGCGGPARAGRGVRRQPDVSPDRRDADHPGRDHGGVGHGCGRRHRFPGAHRRAHHPRQSEVRDDRRAADHVDVHVPRGHRSHRLSVAAGDLRDGAPERHPTRTADGGRDDRVAAGDYGQPGRGGDGRDDRTVRREGHDRLGPAADPDGVRAGHAYRRDRRRNRVDVPRQGSEGRSRVPGAVQGRPDPGAEERSGPPVHSSRQPRRRRSCS